jgi:uncharacterized protein YheU (UPF0270 family)
MTGAEEGAEAPIVVPWRELSVEALQGVVESFVLREGTDYGEREVSHAAKCAQVLRQLERGEACVMFDPATSTVGIVTAKPAGRGP